MLKERFFKFILTLVIIYFGLLVSQNYNISILEKTLLLTILATLVNFFYPTL
jgi:hypothetical protein